MNIKDVIKTSGYRFTGQRNDILNVLLEHQHEHLTIERIAELVTKKNSGIGIATIYRTLLLLDELGLVYKLDFKDNPTLYEVSRDSEQHRHHHLICTKCGSITEFEEDLLETLEKQILLKNKFTVENHSVNFFGICENCCKKDDTV